MFAGYGPSPPRRKPPAPTPRPLPASARRRRARFGRGLGPMGPELFAPPSWRADDNAAALELVVEVAPVGISIRLSAPNEAVGEVVHELLERWPRLFACSGVRLSHVYVG